mmetsp:Transcript_22069/g.28182  ORF Transcript_22069/g.28182 Transcript_22069/m.28182 type:complete len:311 (-) Transcript_22069:236-1168(-)
MTDVDLQIDNAEKEIEIISLRNLLAEERNEKKQLMQQLEELAKDRNISVPTSISFFSPPPDLHLQQQIDSLRISLLSIRDSLERNSTSQTCEKDDSLMIQQAQEIKQLKETTKQQETLLTQYSKEIESLTTQSNDKLDRKLKLLQQENDENKKLLNMNTNTSGLPHQTRINTLEMQLGEWKKLALDQYSTHDVTSLFNPAITKVVHLMDGPPLSPQAAQFYSSTKSSDKAISELQQQLNDSRKEAKRTAEVCLIHTRRDILTMDRLLHESVKNFVPCAASCLAGELIFLTLTNETLRSVGYIPCSVKKIT